MGSKIAAALGIPAQDGKWEIDGVLYVYTAERPGIFETLSRSRVAPEAPNDSAFRGVGRMQYLTAGWASGKGREIAAKINKKLLPRIFYCHDCVETFEEVPEWKEGDPDISAYCPECKTLCWLQAEPPCLPTP